MILDRAHAEEEDRRLAAHGLQLIRAHLSELKHRALRSS
jgi:hypothetical protein